MSFAFPGDTSLDYFPCRYGRSKLLFRGPRRDLGAPYVAVLGGGETYGKFVAQPWPALLQAASGVPVVNLGAVNAGPDAWAGDAAIPDIAAQARVTLVQVTGAQNLTNRFYSVHPRRNDRFLRASPLLASIYREVDFTEFNFTRHMLHTLYSVSPEKFAILADELRAAWLARMVALLPRLGQRVVLVWMAGHRPEATRPTPEDEPMLVTRAMLDALVARGAGLVEVVYSDGARSQGVAGMVYPAMAEAAARVMPGPMQHAEVAEAVEPVVTDLLRQCGWTRPVGPAPSGG